MDDEEIERILDEYYSKDMHYESGRILGSMYTKPPEIVLRAFFRFYQANLGNSGLYPGTAEMEKKVVSFLLSLTSARSGFGHIVSGGTEANIMAIWAAREMGFRRILATEDAHFSVVKASKLLSLPLKEVGMDEGRMDPSALESILKDGDIVVVTAGTTPLGFIDPVEDVGKLCEERRCFLHVDAAFGGFVIPFLREMGMTDKRFGFDISAVRSVTIDPHKMGMAPYPAGGIVSRENIFEKIRVDAPYLMSESTETLLGTRQSGSVAAAYASILHFGWEGYKNVVRICMEATEYLVRRAREEGFSVPFEPEMNIVNIQVRNARKIRDYMMRRGWSVSANPKYETLRIVVMPHVTERVIEDFLKELKGVKRDYGL